MSQGGTSEAELYRTLMSNKPKKTYLFRSMEPDLAVLGKASLYEFIGVDPTVREMEPDGIAAAADRLIASYPPMSTERSAAARLKQRTLEVLPDPVARVDYDAYLAWSQVRELLLGAQNAASAHDGQLSADEARATVMELARVIGSGDYAQRLFDGCCEAEGIAVTGTQSPAFHLQQVRQTGHKREPIMQKPKTMAPGRKGNATNFCAVCHEPIPDGERFCSTHQRQSQKSNFIVFIVAIVVLLILIAFSQA